MRFRRFHYTKLVAQATGWSFTETYSRINRAKKNYGISFRDYYEKEFYARPETTTERKALSLHRNRDEARLELNEIAKARGVSPESMLEEKRKFCEEENVSLATYIKWRVYDLSESEKHELALKFNRQQALKAELTYKIAVPDRNDIDFNALYVDLEEYKAFIRTFITEEIFQDIETEIKQVITDPELLEADKLRAIAVDMEMTRYILGLSNKEFLMFRLWEKSFQDRMDYVPNSVHTGMMLHINGHELVDICNEKFNTYQTLKPFYNRDFVRYQNSDDINEFKAFINKHDKAVFKPLTQTKGEGVRLVTFKDEVDVSSQNAIKLYAQKLYDEYGDYIFEELIVANDEFKKLNPDAINTIRALVYYDGNDVKIDGVLLRVGRKGSFVDNGALGGILMNADADTGIVITYGADQAGHTYDTHPDTGFKLYGYQIPAWDKAKEMLDGAARMIGPGYIGWDITYDNNGEWVIVEANGTPQLYGIQSTTGKGALPHFIETVGEKALEGFVLETKKRADRAAAKARNHGNGSK